jgi:hypothetical protein
MKDGGFRNTDISVLLPQNLGTKDLATQKATKAPEGAAAGASSGAIIGGTLGWLVGIGALAIPGLGPFIAAGPILAALAGIGVGGTVGGAPARWLAWESQNTRPSVTKAGSSQGASLSRSIATVPNGPRKQKKS